MESRVRGHLARRYTESCEQNKASCWYEPLWSLPHLVKMFFKNCFGVEVHWGSSLGKRRKIAVSTVEIAFFNKT